MASTMVMTPPQISLPTSNGHAVKETEPDMSPGDGVRIDINGLPQEACDEACNQSTPRKARAAVDLPSNMLSPFKNVNFGSNGPNAPGGVDVWIKPVISNFDTPHSVSMQMFDEAQSGNYDTSRAELPNGNSGDQHEEDQNGAALDRAYENTDNGHSDVDSQEKLDFLTVSEPQELAGAFPPTFGHSTSSLAAEDVQSNPLASHPITTKSPSRPASPYVQMNPRGSEAGVSTTNLRSASFQSIKGEFHQHQEHHTVLTSASHPQSQFLLTISAPSPVPSQSGHCELSETGLSCQHQSCQIGEAPQQMGSKEACQLPECVTSRASAGMATAGGAQLEHLLARVKHEKTVSRARAWEEGAKAKAYNRYTRDESKITAWENTMKAKAEARMRKAQENLDKQRAKHIEKMKNAVASAHCKAQEKRAAMEARRAEDIVKAEEIASRIRATGKMPRRCLCLPV